MLNTNANANTLDTPWVSLGNRKDLPEDSVLTIPYLPVRCMQYEARVRRKVHVTSHATCYIKLLRSGGAWLARTCVQRVLAPALVDVHPIVPLLLTDPIVPLLLTDPIIPLLLTDRSFAAYPSFLCCLPIRSSLCCLPIVPLLLTHRSFAAYRSDRRCDFH